MPRTSEFRFFYNSVFISYKLLTLFYMQPTINSPIFKELPYQKASETFHQWTDPRGSYGLNFASPAEANAFAASMADSVNKLKGTYEVDAGSRRKN